MQDVDRYFHGPERRNGLHYSLLFRHWKLGPDAEADVEALFKTVSIPPGGRACFSIGGLGVEFAAQWSMKAPFDLPGALALFEAPGKRPDIRLVATSCRSLGVPTASVLHESGLNWRVRRTGERTLFESYHRFAQTLVSAASTGKFTRYDVRFDEGNWERLRSLQNADRSSFPLPPPLDQVLFVTALARKAGLLVHASGAVVGGRAVVLTGHSGDGKTTLSRMLASQGIELLSDERILLRKVEGAFVAYGTPWPGEGGVVSAAAYPLAGVFILKKAARHRVLDGSTSMLAAELLSRSIVPYYLPDEASEILGLVQDLASTVPLRGLEFSLSDGLLPVLERAA